MDIVVLFSDKHDRQIPDKFGRKHVEFMNDKESGIYRCAGESLTVLRTFTYLLTYLLTP
jgi:hypothetical protein